MPSSAQLLFTAIPTQSDNSVTISWAINNLSLNSAPIDSAKLKGKQWSTGWTDCWAEDNGDDTRTTSICLFPTEKVWFFFNWLDLMTIVLFLTSIFSSSCSPSLTKTPEGTLLMTGYWSLMSVSVISSSVVPGLLPVSLACRVTVYRALVSRSRRVEFFT